MSSDKIVNDAIYGFITLKPYIVTIIDTPEFQRLRSIWQLGVTPFVYPTADHCRFEHSIGTYWLASKLVTKLQKQLEEKKVISDDDVKCVEIAALCHDLGHGPFSHVWDLKVLPALRDKDENGKTFQHDKDFGKVWDILKKNEKVERMLIVNSLNKEHEELIIKLINGETVKGKEILCSIISNSESGMDVDKWDYLARDASYLGHSTTNYRVDIERMIHLARAINKDGDEWKIAFRESESLNMLRVYQLRHYMHKTAYRHKNIVAIELMFVDGIKKCIEKNILEKNKIGTPEWILESTDAIFWSNITKIPTFRRILDRELYKQIYTAEIYVCAEDPTEKLIKYLKEESVKVECLRFGFSKFSLFGTSNPIFKIPFYKANKKDEIFYFEKDHLPSCLQMDFSESQLKVFLVENYESDQIKEKLKSFFENENSDLKLESLLNDRMKDIANFKEVVDKDTPIVDDIKYLNENKFDADVSFVAICKIKKAADTSTISVYVWKDVWEKCGETDFKPNNQFKCEDKYIVLSFGDCDTTEKLIINKVESFFEKENSDINPQRWIIKDDL